MICFADKIILRDGILATAEIMDTSGIYVTIKRNGNIVKVRKTEISSIIINSDTIDLSKYRTPDNYCDTSNNKISVIEDNVFNRDRLYSMISAFPRSDSTIEDEDYNRWPKRKNRYAVAETTTFKYYPYPLKGYFNKDWFNLLVNRIDTRFRIAKIDSNEFYNEISESINTFIIIPLEVAESSYIEIYRGPSELTPSGIYMSSPGIRSFTSESTLRLAIVNTKTRKLLFDKKLSATSGSQWKDDKYKLKLQSLNKVFDKLIDKLYSEAIKY